MLFGKRNKEIKDLKSRLSKVEGDLQRAKIDIQALNFRNAVLTAAAKCYPSKVEQNLTVEEEQEILKEGYTLANICDDFYGKVRIYIKKEINYENNKL